MQINKLKKNLEVASLKKYSYSPSIFLLENTLLSHQLPDTTSDNISSIFIRSFSKNLSKLEFFSKNFKFKVLKFPLILKIIDLNNTNKLFILNSKNISNLIFLKINNLILLDSNAFILNLYLDIFTKLETLLDIFSSHMKLLYFFKRDKKI